MPVNFGLLSPIQQQAQPLMGKAPSTAAPALRQQDNLQDFSNGFLNAYSAGQQIRGNQQAIEMNDIKLKEMKQQEQTAEEMRAAAQQGVQGLLQYYDANDPVGGSAFRKALAEQQQAEATAKTADAQQYQASLMARSNFYGVVNSGRTDEEKARIWKMERDAMADSLKMLFPENYSQENLAAGMAIINFAIADYKSKHPKDSKNPLQNAQSGRADAQAALDEAKKSGDPAAIKQAEQNLAEANQYVTKQATTTQMYQTPGQQVTANVSTDELKKGGEEAAIAKNVITKLNALEVLDKTDKVVQGSLANLQIGTAKGVAGLGSIFGTTINPGTAESEAYDAIAKDLQLDYQTKLKGATSDRDMSIVAKIAPQLTNTKAGRQIMYNWGKAINTQTIQKQEFKRDWAEKHNGSLSGAEDAWNVFMNSESRLNEKTKKFDLNKFSRSHWKSYLDDEFVSKAQEKQQAVSSVPEEVSSPSYSQDEVKAEMKRRGLL